MSGITFQSKLIHSSDPSIVLPVLNILSSSLVKINLEFLKRNPGFPSLFETGVYYKREPVGQENWKDIPTTLEDSHGDCEDLASWLAAEYIMSNTKANAYVYLAKETPRVKTYHVVVKYLDSNGKTQYIDPSAMLGMNQI